MTSPAKVLIVDDHPEVLEVAREALCRASYQVVTATSGSQALALLTADSQIDIVVAEVLLHGMRGTELVSTVRRCHPDSATMLMAGYTDDEVIDPSIPLLRKPFSLRTLTEAVEQALWAASRMRNQARQLSAEHQRLAKRNDAPRAELREARSEARKNVARSRRAQAGRSEDGAQSAPK